MSYVAAIDMHIPNFGCDVDRNASRCVDAVTIDFKAEKFASVKSSGWELNKRQPTAFAGYLVGEDNVRYLFTGLDAISYECVGSADRFVVRWLDATALPAVGVSLERNLGRQPAVPAVTILEGPVNGH